MSKEEFANIKHLPDPMIGDEDPFEMAFQKETTEKDRPSSKANQKKKVSSIHTQCATRKKRWANASVRGIGGSYIQRESCQCEKKLNYKHI